MPDSFAGITVPEGEPGTVRDAAGTFRSLAGGLHGVSGELQAVPGLVADWQGPASAAFAGTVPTNGSCIERAAEAMNACAQAARTYADELETAKEEAKAAIAEARDAQRRIDAAQRDLENAQAAQIAASDAMLSANQRLASGAPDPSAMADLDAAGAALGEAQAAEGDARRRLEQAQDDLERAKRRGERAEKDARDAARAAAAAFEGVAGGSVAAAVFGGSPSAVGDRVLARVRAGDYSVLDEVPMNYLPEDTQRAIGAEVAKDADRAAVGEGAHSFDQMAGIAGRYQHDEEFATGFYNQLGGRGARDFVSNVAYFQNPEPNGWDDPELIATFAPFATLLGTATRAGGLRPGFTGGFLRHDLPARDRLGGHHELKAFVMAGRADNYSGRFLADVGHEVLIAPQDPANEDIPGHVRISDHQDFMEYLAGNPEAAGRLLAGRHGPENHFSNAGALLLQGPWYTDDGKALGALITAGAHELRGSDHELANAAAHAVIQAAPPHVEHLGEEAKPALVTILDDHIVEFDDVAMERAFPDTVTPSNPAGIEGLTYEEAEDYLTALVGDDGTRGGATAIVGDRVAHDMYQAVARDDTSFANRAGALSEMGVLATAEANLDDARTADTMNGLAKAAANKLVALTPPSRVPGFSLVADKALGEIFSTEAVKQALEEQAPAQIDAFQHVKQLSIRYQVELGHLPSEARDMLRPDGSIDISIVDGPHGDQDVIRYDSDADGEADTNLQWDLDRDGRIDPEEREITERELYDAGLGPAEAAADAITNLHEAQYAAEHPPDIDDLPVPDGYVNDKESGVEKLWPFDPSDEDAISDGSRIVAGKEDLRWDPAERVYHLTVETDSGPREFHYQLQGDDEWKLVEKVNGQWELVD